MLDNINHNLGDTFRISPIIYFAINPYVSINWGFVYQYTLASKIKDTVVSSIEGNVGYSAGVSYEMIPGLVLGIDVESMSTGFYDNNVVNFTMSYRTY